MWIKLVASKICLSKLFPFSYNVLNLVFLTTSLSTTALNLFKPTGTVFNLPTSKSSTSILKLLKLVGTEHNQFINVYFVNFNF